MVGQQSEPESREPKDKNKVTGFTRREFFRNTGIAALTAVTLKFLPNTLFPNIVSAEWIECPDCQEPYWPAQPICDCYCFYAAGYNSCFTDPGCGECVGFPPRTSDLFFMMDIWANYPGWGCCWAFCYTVPFQLIECQSSGCPLC